MYRGVPELAPNGTSLCPQGCDTSVFRQRLRLISPQIITCATGILKTVEEDGFRSNKQ